MCISLGDIGAVSKKKLFFAQRRKMNNTLLLHRVIVIVVVFVTVIHFFVIINYSRRTRIHSFRRFILFFRVFHAAYKETIDKFNRDKKNHF